MNTLVRDIRFAVRNLLNRPSFTVIVILVLALGIGSTTAIFSIIDAILLRPLPYATADRLVRVIGVGAKGNEMALTPPNFQDLRAQSRSFEQLSVAAGSFPMVVTGGVEPGHAKVSYASASFFKAMGVAPFAGRLFLPEEEKWGGPVAVIVSYGYWQKMLGGRADFHNITLNVDGVSANVVGVMPGSFDYRETEIWITTNTEPANTSRTGRGLPVIGLVRQGTSLTEAQAEASLIAKQLRQTYGEKTDAVDFTLIPLQGFFTRSVRQGLWLLLGSVGLLLLIACANFSNLLLNQILSRQREFTLRVALGASRARLTRQVMVENLALTIPGAIFGILLASFGVRLLLFFDNGTLPRFNAIGIDIRVLAFACGLGILIALVLSFLPGVRSRHDLAAGLKAGSRGHIPGGKGARLRGALVVGQIALTLILLTGAGLLARSFLKVMAIKPGFDTGGAVAMTLSLPTTISVEEDERIRQFYVQLVERVSQLPGVTAVGGINVLPLTGSGTNSQFLIDNDESQPGHAVYRVASAGYFSAMRIPLLAGRVFEGSDKVAGQHVCVISQSLAQRYWPNGDAIGKRIQFGNMDQDKRLMEIVGIVADVRNGALEREPQPTVYGYSIQRPQWWQVFRLAIVVRSQSDPQALIPSLRATVQSLRSDVPSTFETMEEVYSSAFATRRYTLTLFGVFGGVALLITIIGLYGMLTFSVTQRTREMGIRMALGAQRGNVLRLVIKQGFKLAAFGMVVGLFGAWALTRLMANLLFDVTPTDPLTIVAVVLALAIVALIACYAPARRATKVDPLVALREE
jgi:putative ABC transport system permease protein